MWCESSVSLKVSMAFCLFIFSTVMRVLSTGMIGCVMAWLMHWKVSNKRITIAIIAEFYILLWVLELFLN